MSAYAKTCRSHMPVRPDRGRRHPRRLIYLNGSSKAAFRLSGSSWPFLNFVARLLEEKNELNVACTSHNDLGLDAFEEVSHKAVDTPLLLRDTEQDRTYDR